MTSPNRSLIGRRNRQSGEMFEKWLEDSCEFYFSQGVACIDKTPEPMKPLKPYGDRKMGQYIACFTKKAQPDFKGALCDGSCIVFDAKHTDTDKIQKGAVTEKQWETFDRYEKMGARCYIVVSLGMNEFFRVPWNVWKSMKEMFGHRYMTLKELTPYQVIQKYCKILFLEGVELHEDIKD